MLTAQAVRFGEWKALRGAPNLPVELYDLDPDPGETTDLANARPNLIETSAAYMADAHWPAPAWPLQERTLWTALVELKESIAAWAREGQAHGRWWGILADIWDSLER